MVFGRNKCVIKGVNSKKVISHDELMDRIRKSFYYGHDTSYEDMEVSRPLAQYTSELFSEPQKGHSLNRLNIVTAGSIHSTPCTLIMALIYLDRLSISDPCYVRRITPSELFLVSMMVSTKFYCGLDEEIYLSEWAKQGNISENRLKELELEFLYAIDWNVFVSNDQFFNKLESIEKILAQREGIRRGWLTYTELINLLPSFTIAKFFLNNIAIMAVSYAASVMTIAGAFFIVSHIPGNGLINRNGNYMNTNNSDISSNINSSNTTIENNVLNENIRLCKNGSETEINVITNELNNGGLCQAINIEEELKMFEEEYNNDNYIKNNSRQKCFKFDDYSVINIHSKDKRKRNDKDWKNNLIDDENCRNTIKNHNQSMIWYLLLNESKSLISLSFDWFKFV